MFGRRSTYADHNLPGRFLDLGFWGLRIWSSHAELGIGNEVGQRNCLWWGTGALEWKVKWHHRGLNLRKCPHALKHAQHTTRKTNTTLWGGTNIYHDVNLRCTRRKINIAISKFAGVTAGTAKQNGADQAMETTCIHNVMGHGGDQLCDSEVIAKEQK